MQVDLLQKLRESESQRRLETASETESLRNEKDKLSETVEKLQKVLCLDNVAISSTF